MPDAELPDVEDELELLEVQADPFALLSGMGDGLPDVPLEDRRNLVRTHPPTENSPIQEYRIAGFPSAAIQVAFVPLMYDEGFPTFDTGKSFWQQLPYEPQDAYLTFERFLLMAQGVAPSYDEASEEADEGIAASGTRSIEALVAQMNISGQMSDQEILIMADKWRTYSHLYYWGLRTRAYDLFRVVQYRHQQELRAIETHDDHYIQARTLRARLMKYMGDEQEFWELMTPKIGIDMLKTLTQLERISVGLPAAGPMPANANTDNRAGQSLEMTFKTVAQTHAGDLGGGSIIDEEGSLLDVALDDPQTTQILQQLIIRTGGGNAPGNDNGN